MAAAGDDPRPHAWSCSRARSARASRPPSSTQAAEKFIRSQGADAGLQGLPRLPGLDLRLAERDGRPRHPGPATSSQRGDIISRRHRRRLRRLGRRRAPRTFAGRRRSRRSPRKLLDVTEALAVRRRRAVPRRATASATSRTPSRQHVEAEGLSVVRSLVGHGIGRDMHEEPQIPNYGDAGQGPAARGGHGPGRRADGQRRAPHGAHGRRRLGDLLPGRLAGRPLRVHDRHHRRRAAHPHARGTSRRRAAPRPSWRRAALRRTSRGRLCYRDLSARAPCPLRARHPRRGSGSLPRQPEPRRRDHSRKGS